MLLDTAIGGFSGFDTGAVRNFLQVSLETVLGLLESFPPETASMLCFLAASDFRETSFSTTGSR